MKAYYFHEILHDLDVIFTAKMENTKLHFSYPGLVLKLQDGYKDLQCWDNAYNRSDQAEKIDKSKIFHVWLN